MRYCKKCRSTKPEIEFGKASRRPDGKQIYCKLCVREDTAKRRQDKSYREREREYSKQYNRDHKEERRTYRQQYEADPVVLSGIRKKTRIWWDNNRIKKMYYSAKASAKEHGVAFNLEPSDIVIPDTCPVLGIKLAPNATCASDNSPSIDRIIPDRGYVKGNIAIISYRANTIKNDATVEELRTVADWLESVTQSESHS